MTIDEKVDARLATFLEKLGINRTGSDDTPPAPGTASVTSESDELAALKAEKAELLKRAEVAEAEALAARKSSEEAEKAARLERNERAIEALKSSFKITPAAGDELAKLAANNPDAFEAALPCFEALEPHPTLSSGVSGAAQRQKLEGGGSPDADADTLHNLTLARMKETKETYKTAFAVVCRENPELSRSVAAPRATAQGE